MNIFHLITGNAMKGPQTLRFPERHTPAAEYRGAVVMDAAKCVACGVCDYVCVSRAISLKRGTDRCEWIYDPAACTYCGRCVDHCSVGALTQATDRGASYGRPGELAASVIVVYPSCSECGKPMLPYSEALAGEAFNDVSPELRERLHLCERCRQSATATALKQAFGAPGGTERNTDGR